HPPCQPRSPAKGAGGRGLGSSAGLDWPRSTGAGVRREDAAPDEPLTPERNTALFARTIEALRRGEAVLIFPEGVSQPEPRLMPLCGA
ncbi:MAG TPA: hypothetical protein VNO23_19350, partial [Candidatus Binatia bacterium]|nr:hypothetical protein [Candidatus Binatia bacterium]